LTINLRLGCCARATSTRSAPRSSPPSEPSSSGDEQLHNRPSDAPPPGIVPLRWLQGRRIGEATVPGSFVDIGDAGSLATLRTHLAARAIHYGLSEIDAATIRLDAPRRFTQEASRLIYEWHEDHGDTPSTAPARPRTRLTRGASSPASERSAQRGGYPYKLEPDSFEGVGEYKEVGLWIIPRLMV